MKREEIIHMAEASGIKDSLLYEHMKCDVESLTAFAKLVLQHYRSATLDTIDELFNSEDPNPMYQTAYNHALIHMQEFIINMEKNT